jgi:hypothetical protein
MEKQPEVYKKMREVLVEKKTQKHKDKGHNGATVIDSFIEKIGFFFFVLVLSSLFN